MKTLIVYYSKTGHTKRVALDLGKRFGAEVEEIIDKKERSGFLNWFRSGRDSMKKIGTQIGELKNDPAQYDLVVFGSPVWGWNMAPAVRTYIEKEKGKIKKYAFFVTSGNTDSQKIRPNFTEIIGFDPEFHAGFNAREIKDMDLFEQKLSNFADSIKKCYS